MSDTQKDWTERFNEEPDEAQVENTAPSGQEQDTTAAASTTADAVDASDFSGESGETRQRKEADTADAGSLFPAPTFSTFILSLASSALVQLGEVPDPATGEISEDLIVAKHTIDVLSMLQEKTANGLDQDETRLLEGLLYELRMKFVMKK